MMAAEARAEKRMGAVNFIIFRVIELVFSERLIRIGLTEKLKLKLGNYEAYKDHVASSALLDDLSC
jgi:hypothetical protein